MATQNFTAQPSVPNIRDALDYLDYEVVLLEPGRYDSAIVGLVSGAAQSTPVACYDREKVIQILMEEDGMSDDDAEAYFEFNIEGAYMGEGSPMFMTPIPMM